MPSYTDKSKLKSAHKPIVHKRTDFSQDEKHCERLIIALFAASGRKVRLGK